MREVIIIGSGPAGLTASLYCARANLKPLCFEGSQPGGQLTTTTDVENFPGYPEGIMGPDMMQQFRQQAERFGTELITRDVTKVDLNGKVKKVWVEDELYEARAVIISTGARARMLGLESEQRLLGHGVSTCATCDGFFFRDQPIAVVGGGDSAMEEANFLTKFATKVTVIHRRNQLRASKIMQDRAKANEKIDFIWDTAVEEVIGEKEVEKIRLKNLKTDETSELAVKGMFVAIGHIPNTQIFKDQDLAMDEEGYIIAGKDPKALSATNMPGVFACGDVQDTVYRQAVTAAGSGCMAAIDAERWLEANPE